MKSIFIKFGTRSFSLILLISLATLIWQPTTIANAKTFNSKAVMIMNLHMENGKITLNSLHVANVRLPKKYSLSDNYLVIYNRMGKKVFEKNFDVPKKLHFDYINEETGKLEGGEIIQEKLDFVIKLPHSEGMQKVDFFKSAPKNAKTLTPPKLIGSIEIPSSQQKSGK